MLGDLQMNGKRITGLSNLPNADLMMKQQIKSMLTIIFQKAILNHLILQKMFSNI